jgi:hypothetical protein
MKIRKFGAIVCVAVLTVATVAAPSAEATGTQRSISWVRSYMVGKWTSGPNAATKWQRVQITGSHKDPCFNFYDIDDVMHQYVDPAVVTSQPRTATAADRALRAASMVCPTVVAYSWFNPFSWDWGDILGDVWNTLWNSCLSGTAAGLVGTASGTLVWNLLARGAKLVPGAAGYATAAISGCVVKLVFG